MAENPPPPEIEHREAKKIRAGQDFWLGLIGGIVFNLILYALTSPLIKLASGIWLVCLILLPWVLNIVVLLVAEAMNRPSIVWGLLASLGLSFGLYLCSGSATC